MTKHECWEFSSSDSKRLVAVSLIFFSFLFFKLRKVLKTCVQNALHKSSGRPQEDPRISFLFLCRTIQTWKTFSAWTAQSKPTPALCEGSDGFGTAQVACAAGRGGERRKRHSPVQVVLHERLERATNRLLLRRQVAVQVHLCNTTS